MADETYYQPTPLHRVVSIGNRPRHDPPPGELAPSDPRDMPRAGYDPRFDFDKGALHTSGSEIEAAAPDEHGPPPTTMEEARAGCRSAWVDPAQLTSMDTPRAVKQGPFASVAFVTSSGGTEHNGSRQTLYLVPVVGVTLLGDPAAAETPHAYSLVTAQPPSTTLQALLAKQMEAPYKHLYSEHDALRWVLQIAKGLRYLHEHRRRHVHGFLHPGTVALTGAGPPSSWEAMLTDYDHPTLLIRPTHDAAKALALRIGTSRMLEAARNGTTMFDRHGKPIQPHTLADTDAAMVYLAPEAFAPGVACGAASDVYALGWLLFELYMREQTYLAARFRDRVRDMHSFIDLYTLRGARPDIPSTRIPPRIASLVAACWAAEPLDRPEAAHVVEVLQAHMLAAGVEEQARVAKGAEFQSAQGCSCVVS